MRFDAIILILFLSNYCQAQCVEAIQASENIIEESYPSNSFIDFEDFEVTIYNFQHDGMTETFLEEGQTRREVELYRPDEKTIQINSWVFQSAKGKYFCVVPKNTEYQYRASYAYHQFVAPIKTPFGKPYWEELSEYIYPEEDDQSLMQIADLDIQALEEQCRTALGMKDTLVPGVGEMAPSGSMILNDTPMWHFLDYIMIRIEKMENNQVIDTQYLRIESSYGC